MNRIIEYTIPTEYDGYSIERYLVERGYTHQNIVELKKIHRSVVINDEWMHMGDRLTEGDVLTVNIIEDANSEHIPPVKLPFPVVYEDEDIVVVDKPSGMPIHPSLNNYENTLGNAAAYYYQSQGVNFVFRCINRLDRDTSGLTIIAKHMVSAGNLYNQMTERKIHREYIAIVQDEDMSGESGYVCESRFVGKLPDRMTIDYPIARREGSTIEREVNMDSGETAVTHFEVMDRRDNLALLRLHLDTGRTHQIRVHMSYIGHPLIGDWLYNPTDTRMTRQALHSASLDFIHPITGQNMHLESNIPEDMRLIWNSNV